jgi:hypothetical protein
MYLSIPNSARLLLAFAMLTLASVARAEQAEWPAAPSRLSLSTPFGTLSVKDSDYVYESILLYQGQPVKPTIKGIVNITYAFSLPKTQAALISVNLGSYECPYVYRWVLIDKKGYQVSPKFGSCSNKIKVSATAHSFTVETPSAEDPNKIDVYVYDGDTIQHSTHP